MTTGEESFVIKSSVMFCGKALLPICAPKSGNSAFFETKCKIKLSAAEKTMLIMTAAKEGFWPVVTVYTAKAIKNTAKVTAAYIRFGIYFLGGRLLFCIIFLHKRYVKPKMNDQIRRIKYSIPNNVYYIIYKIYCKYFPFQKMVHLTTKNVDFMKIL